VVQRSWGGTSNLGEINNDLKQKSLIGKKIETGGRAATLKSNDNVRKLKQKSLNGKQLKP